MVGYKTRIKRSLVSSGVLSFAGRLRGVRTAILRYHSIQDEPDAWASSIGRGIVHSTNCFQAQMEWVARHCEPVTLDDVAEAAQSGRALPRRSVAITFDDGFADNFTLARPILERLGMRAAFYVTVDCIEPHKMPWFCRLRHAFAATTRTTWEDSTEGQTWQLTDAGDRRQAFLSASSRCARRTGDAQEATLALLERELEVDALAPAERLMMSWQQVRQLKEAGHVVGSHTLTHPNLAQVTPDEVFRELSASKKKLEEVVDGPIHHFSYPSPILQPHWTPETMAICASLGYRTAVTCTPGAASPRDPLLCLKRVSVPESVDDLAWSVQCAFLGRCT